MAQAAPLGAKDNLPTLMGEWLRLLVLDVSTKESSLSQPIFEWGIFNKKANVFICSPFLL
jgi:hypothetical protein